MNLTNLTKKINEAAGAYNVGNLQQFRAKLHGKRARTWKIFSEATTFVTGGSNYAFHDGGRTELQFNVGEDEGPGSKRYWRHGVAFSFEPGQTLPDPTELQPKVDRFNDWVRTSGGLLKHFRMWDYQRSKGRSKDRPPGQISQALLDAEAFVFLGANVAEEKVDVDRILQDFDVLYPLYQFVESENTPKAAPAKLPEEVPPGSTYIVGGVQQILVNRYERDPKARDECIRHYGTICVVCKFDFVAKYGPVMKDFIHVHHLKQLSKVAAGYELDPIRDLRPVCPNCHAVAHHRSEPYSLEEVGEFL
jgi:HNH endonuclease